MMYKMQTYSVTGPLFYARYNPCTESGSESTTFFMELQEGNRKQFFGTLGFGENLEEDV